MITNETWEKVKGFTRYEVSNAGNVRNLHTKQLKAIRRTKTGYCITDLRENGMKKTSYVHRLVAEAFIENSFSFPCINHIDEDKSNNCVENLEWCDISYNNSYGNRIENMRQTKRKMYGKPVAQLDSKTGKVLKVFGSMSEAAESVGVTIQAIIWGLSKTTHTAGGFRWVVVQ